jgi:TIR domain
MAHIFLSYSSDDHAKTRNLAEALTREGWEVFWDRNIPVGKSWDVILEEELPKAKAITSLWSPSSIKSDWVRTESYYGHKHKKLFPAMIEEADVPIAFSLTQHADLTAWDGVSTNHAGFQKLVSALKQAAGDPSGSKPTVPRDPLIQTGDSPTHLFLGYSREDQPIAEKLVNALKQHGFSMWWDPEIPVGASFQDSIVGALEASKFVLVLWSNKGVQSNWVQAEARWALEQSKLVGLTTEPVTVPLGLGVAPTLSFEAWDGSTKHPAFLRLLQTLGGSVNEDVTPDIAPSMVTAKRRLRFIVAGAILVFCFGLALGIALTLQMKG